MRNLSKIGRTLSTYLYAMLLLLLFPAFARGASQDFYLKLTQNYCDTSLPYTYTDAGKPDGSTLVIIDGSKADKFCPKWKQWVKNQPKNSNNPDTKIQCGLLPDKLTKHQMSDAGEPILENELSADGSDAEKLLVRTLYGRSVLANACNPNLNATGDGTDKGLIVGTKSSHAAASSKHFSFSEAQYYLIDIVRWQIKEGINQIASDSWYVLNYSDKQAARRQFPYTFHPFVSGDLRILGSSKVIFLAIHLAPKSSSSTDYAGNGEPKWFNNVDISYKIHADSVVPANVQDLSALVDVIVGTTIPSPPSHGGMMLLAPPKSQGKFRRRPQFQGKYGAGLITNLSKLPVKLTSTMTASFTGVVDSKVEADPYAIQPPADSGSTSALPASSSPTSTDSGNTPASTAPKPTKSKPAQPTSSSLQCDPSKGQNNVQTPCTSTQTITDEGLYRWDVSIGIPLQGLNETQYSSAGVITPKTVSRELAYGMFDLAPWGEDFIHPPSLGIPHLMVGLPISGKVFDHPFFGAGEAFNLAKIPKAGPPLAKWIPLSLRFYAGIVYNKEFRPSPGLPANATPAQLAANLIPRRVAKMQYGIEFSVKEIASKLTKSKSSTK